jgi:hypothetical protein
MRAIRVSLAVLPALAGCYVKAEPPPGATPPVVRAVTYSSEKEALVADMERRMNALLRHYQAELNTIQETLEVELERLAPPVRIGAFERTLSSYGAADEELYFAAIDRLVDEAVERVEAIAGREASATTSATIGAAQLEIYALAAEVGGRGQGAGYGFVSGVQEVDERAAVTVELLKGYVSIQDLRALGALRKGGVVDCSEVFRHDVLASDLRVSAPHLAAQLGIEVVDDARLARLRLYRSDPLEGFRFDRQETQGMVFACENVALPVGVEIALIQAVRPRVVRGGMIVEDFGWRLDPSVPTGDGRLPLVQGLVDPRQVASEPFFPAVNVDHSQFERLTDFTVVYDYKTMALDEAGGAVIGAVDWQIQWNVSMTREVSFVDAIAPEFDRAAGPLFAELVAAAARGEETIASREPTPGDRMPHRKQATADLTDLEERDLGDGRKGRLVSLVASDHLKLDAAAWRYLAARRTALLARDASFMSYLDGLSGRRVLSLIDIAEGSPLLDLGFRDGDLILALNGDEISTLKDLHDALAEHGRAARIEVGVVRSGAYRMLRYDLEGVAAGEPLPRDLDGPEVEGGEPTETQLRLERLLAPDDVADAGR